MFNTFKNCLLKKNFDNSSKFNSFMFCRWLSGNPSTIQLANTLNFYYKELDDCSQYNIVKEIVNLKFIKFPKFKIEVPQTIEIQKKYKISEEKALDYYDILNFVNTKNNI